jgi:hypothetical protein
MYGQFKIGATLRADYGLKRLKALNRGIQLEDMFTLPLLLEKCKKIHRSYRRSIGVDFYPTKLTVIYESPIDV